MTLEEVLAKATELGFVILHPTIYIAPTDSSKDIVHIVCNELFGLNGTYKTIKQASTEDLLVAVGVPHGAEFETLDEELGEWLDAYDVLAAPANFAGGEDVLCFWSEENPYPGT